MTSKSRSFLLPRVLSWLVVCSPAWVYLAHLPSFGELQGNDYYGIVGRIMDGEVISDDPIRWLSLKSNEHRVTLPVLVYVLNMKLTHGNNLGLTVFALLLLTFVLVRLVTLLPADLRSVLWARTALGFAMAMFCFTPVAAHSVAMGFSGTIWFFANALAVSAIAALTRRAGRQEVWALWPVLLLGILAAFTHSTYLILWPTLLAGALFLRIGRRGLIALAAGMTLVLSLFILTFQPFTKHPTPNTSELEELLRYVAVYLGSLFSPDLATAKVLGLAGCLASAVVLTLLVVLSWTSRSARRDFAPWLMVQLYGLGNAALAAVSRSGFGESQARASRYASLAALFWIGLLASAAILAWRYRPASRRGQVVLAVGSAALVASLGAAMQQRGSEVVDRFLIRGHRQRVAAMALSLGVRDDDILRRAVTPAPGQVWAVYDFMKASGHVPFDDPPRWRVGERIDPSLLHEHPHRQVPGELDRIVVLPDGYVRLGGWAFGREIEVAEILILDDEGSIQGEAFTGIRRPELKRKVHPDAVTAGWEGYARVDPARSTRLQAYVRTVDDPGLHPLPTRREIAQQMRWEAPSSESF